MHHFPYPSYLRTHRKRWALTQPELGHLLGGISAGLVSKYETLSRKPSVDALIGSEFIFGEHARRLFPGLYARVELEVATRAALMAEALAGSGDKKIAIKRELLEAIAQRAASDEPAI